MDLIDSPVSSLVGSCSSPSALALWALYGGPDLLAGLPTATVVVADRNYDSRAIIDLVSARGRHRAHSHPEPVKQQRTVDVRLYRQCNNLER